MWRIRSTQNPEMYWTGFGWTDDKSKAFIFRSRSHFSSSSQWEWEAIDNPLESDHEEACFE